MSYPNAYCVKCGTHTDTQQKHTVLLANSSRALRGVCPACASDVYKILSKNKDFGPKTVADAAKTAPTKLAKDVNPAEERRIPLTRRAEDARKAMTWAYVMGAGLIVGIVIGFLAYTVQ